MSDDTEHSTFRLDLDASEFLESALKAKEAVAGIADTEKIAELAEGLASAGLVLGSFGLALYGIKETIDLVFDAERIKQVQVQFESLSNSAGVYHRTLLEGLKEASAGWVDDTVLMKSANKALTELEVGAEKLPNLMELARKASIVMGGDVTQNFEAITQAVSTGTTRQLRHLGLIIDQQKAYRDYAKSIGVTVDVLDQAGKQQAVLNAVLEKGHEKFGEQGEDVRKSINTWEQVKATITEIKDTFILAFEKIAGPTVSNFFSNIKSMADDAKTYIQDKLGSGAEQSAAHLERVRARIMEIKGAMIDIDQKQMKGLANAFDTSSLQAYQRELKKLETELPKVQNIVTANTEKEKEEAQRLAGIKDQVRTVDLEKEKKQKAEAAAAISKLDQELVQEELKSMDSVGRATEIYQSKLKAQGSQVQVQIDAVRAKEAEGVLTHAQAAAQIERLDALKVAKMKGDTRELEKEQLRALDNYAAHSKGTFDGISRGFQVMSQKNKIALHDWGKFGEDTAASFSSHATSSIQAWATGSKSATDAMEEMFAGMVGQMATQYGQMMMLASIFPFDPVGMAAGIALVALGGVLGAVGSSSGATASAGGASGASAQAPAPAAPGATADTSAPASGAATSSATPGKSVNIVIQGHMLMADQTQRWLVDQVRNAADATDFKIQSVGGGL